MIFDFTSAQNEIQTALDSVVSVVAEAVQSCPTFSASQTIDISGNCVVDVGTLKQDQAVNVDSDCVQKGWFTQNVQQDISEKLEQLAKSVDSGLSAANATIAKNTVQSIIDLRSELLNSFALNCNGQQYQQNVLCRDNGSLKGTWVGQKQVINATIDCTMQSKSVQDATTKVTLDISQKADAEQQGLFGGLLAAAIAIAAIIGVVFVVKAVTGSSKGGSSSGASKLWKVGVVSSIGVLLVSVVFIALYGAQLWPYYKILPTSTDEDKNHNTAIFVPFAIAGGLSLAGLVALIWYHYKKGGGAAS